MSRRREQDDGDVLRLLGAVRARTRLRHAIYAATAACVSAALTIGVARLLGASFAVRTSAGAAAAVLIWIVIVLATRRLRTLHGAAILVERADPALRNIVVTAEELIARPGLTPTYMRARVLADAAARSANIPVARAVPLTNASLLLWGGAVLLGCAVVLRVPHQVVPGGANSTAGLKPTAAHTGDLIVDVVPPPYTALASSRLRNPSAIEAIAGSRATITLIGEPPGVGSRVRINGVNLVMHRAGEAVTADTVLTESGYLAVDGAGSGARRLLPLSVVPDRAPDVRITAPARDLRMTGSSSSIAIDATAQDDLGLSSMEIRYTKISGTGEQFEFREGTVPASIERRSGTTWRAVARLALGTMKLEPGDALVYRAVARDGRTGDAGLGTSETYFIEVAGSGEIALAGFEMPPDRERYALSQQMIVLKIERLRARESSMTKTAVHEAATNIGAEQRAVRANFVFLLGGTVEDEEQEAEGSTEILEGRFENRARQEILLATRLMTRVEQALSAASTAAALPPAREAAQALQRAFGHSRYLLRALPDRGRIDPSRRLTGDRASAEDWRRRLTPPDPDQRAEAARAALNELLAVSAGITRDPVKSHGSNFVDAQSMAERIGQLAEHVLRIEPAAADVQASSRQLLGARDAIIGGRPSDARAALQRAAPAILARALRERLDVAAPTAALDRLAGALAREGGRR